MRLHKVDGTYIDMEISKATAVETNNPMVYLDKLRNGTWRLVWDKALMEEFSSFKSMEMIRED